MWRTLPAPADRAIRVQASVDANRAISGQSVPILRCVKYCALRGRSGYIFPSPILRDRTRMPVLIYASATHDGFQVAEARHEANSCRYAALKSQQRPIRTQTRSEFTLFEGKKSS